MQLALTINNPFICTIPAYLCHYLYFSHTSVLIGPDIFLGNLFASTYNLSIQ